MKKHDLKIIGKFPITFNMTILLFYNFLNHILNMVEFN